MKKAMGVIAGILMLFLAACNGASDATATRVGGGADRVR